MEFVPHPGPCPRGEAPNGRRLRRPIGADGNCCHVQSDVAPLTRCGQHSPTRSTLRSTASRVSWSSRPKAAHPASHDCRLGRPAPDPAPHPPPVEGMVKYDPLARGAYAIQHRKLPRPQPRSSRRGQGVKWETTRRVAGCGRSLWCLPCLHPRADQGQKEGGRGCSPGIEVAWRLLDVGGRLHAVRCTVGLCRNEPDKGW